MAQFLQVQGLKKSFPGTSNGQELVVFEDVSFEIAKGEFVCIIGHSRCGKTTLQNVLDGLEKPSAGYAFIDGREITGPSLDRGVVFQAHALMPWLSVRGNIAFAVKSKWPQWSITQINEHVQKFINLVHLQGSEEKKPSQLSGGMKQRVGIARAFAIQPKMLLLDEPFGALDALTRGNIQDELLEIVKETKQTVFMITHDVDEAILLADKIFLMSNGPKAVIAEIVENTMPRDRSRSTMHHDQQFYWIRNHLIDFLVNRAKAISAGDEPKPLKPHVVQPGLLNKAA